MLCFFVQTKPILEFPFFFFLIFVAGFAFAFVSELFCA